MSELESLTEADDPELAELVAEIGERLRRGETVRPEDYLETLDNFAQSSADHQDDGRLAHRRERAPRAWPPR